MSEHPDDGAKPDGTPPDGTPPDGTPTDRTPPDRSGSRGARMAWGSTGITFFLVGVVFTLTMPDNIALGISFLALGVVFFTLAGSQRAPGDGPASAAPPEPPASSGSSSSPASPPEPPRA